MDRTAQNLEPKGPVVHNSKLVGKGGKHPLTVWARENKLRMTPKDLSTATVYCPFSLHARVDADVSGLEHALKVYWRNNKLLLQHFFGYEELKLGW